MRVQQNGDVQSIIKIDDDKLITGTVQDCTPIYEDATRRRNEGMTGTKEMRHAARFPAVLVEKYCNENGVTFHEFMGNKVHVRRMLGDPALMGFRIWECKVA